MKVSLNWLTDYVDVSMSVQELAGVLTRIGLKVEAMEQTPSDVVLDLDVTCNRPDCLGHLGVAREVAAAMGLEIRPPGEVPQPQHAAAWRPQTVQVKVSGKASELTSVEVMAPDLCPRYTARVIRGVKVGPSPSWMVERLGAVGIRSINNVVDVTNYVMMEYSQPLHSFDFDKLAGRRIIVRRALGGELIVSIDQTRCTLDESMLVIADAEKAVAVAGIMGGLNTEVTVDTAKVLLEAAVFDPLSVRRTSRKLALMSESNYRFERGIDPVAVDAASLRACQLICQLGGGTLADGLVDVWAKPHVPPRLTLRPQRCNALLGVEVPAERQVEILLRLGLSPEWSGGKIVCTIPPWRGDLRCEADLIEEVARLEGYDGIPLEQKVTHAVSVRSPLQQLRGQVAAAMSAAGFDETISIAFIDEREAKLFVGDRFTCVDPIVRRTNNVLRPTLLPSMLQACKTNQDVGVAEVSLYELASVFPPGESGPIGGERLELAMVTTRELAELRGALEAVAEAIASGLRLEIRPGRQAGMDDSAAAEVLLDAEPVGAMGQVSWEALEYYGLARPVAAATVNFDALAKRCEPVRRYEALPRFPAVRRDLSLIVDEAVTWRQLAEVIESVPQPTRVALDYVTTYCGKPVPQGRKSVTVAVTYRWAEGTLRGEQVDQQVAEVVEAAKEKLSAELRT